MIKKILLLSVIYFVVGGCAVYKDIQPGQVSISDVTIDNPQQWSQIKRNGLTMWTFDGMLLNQVVIYKVKNDDPIFRHMKTDDEQYNVTQSLTLDEARELYNDAIQANGATNLMLLDQNYRNIGSFEATEFDIQYDSAGSGLSYQEIVLLTRLEDGFSVIVCSAPKLHYFPAYEPQFRAIIASARPSAN